MDGRMFGESDSGISRSASSIAALFALCGIGTALFVLDIVMPLGIADGIGYAPLLSVSYWLRGRYATIIPAGVYSVLIVAGQLVGHGGIGSAAMLNRGIALLTLWVVALLVDRLKQSTR
jgi:hypothetical protein